MSDLTMRAALLRAVIDSPEDDCPRLVFADWLTEHDQPEWGDFIRRHCALTRCLIGDPNPFAAFHTCPREQMSLLPPCHLRAAIRRALLGAFDGIRQQLDPSRKQDNLPFQYLSSYVGRGFVEWLALRGGRAVRVFCEYADKVLAATPLLWLSLERRFGGETGEDKVTGELLRRLFRVKGIERLRALDLQPLQLDDELAEALLSAGPELPQIRAYDEIHTPSLRDRLKDRFGEKLKLDPLPDYLHRR